MDEFKEFFDHKEGCEPTLKDMGEIWNKLNKLMRTDKQGYEKLTKRALNFPKETLLQPVFLIKCKGKKLRNTKLHFINVCKSKCVVAPPTENPDEVPIVLSNSRLVVHSESKKKVNVYDAVMNEKVLQKCEEDNDFKSKLIELIQFCIHETFGATLESEYEISNLEYQGPWAWNKDGTAKKFPDTIVSEKDTTDESEQLDSIKGMTPETLLSNLENNAKDDTSQEFRSELKLFTTKSSGNTTIGGSLVDEQREGISGGVKKVLIEEINTVPEVAAASESYNSVSLDGSNYIVTPEFEVKLKSNLVVIRVQLPKGFPSDMEIRLDKLNFQILIVTKKFKILLPMEELKSKGLLSFQELKIDEMSKKFIGERCLKLAIPM